MARADQRGDAAGRRQGALVARAAAVGVGGDEARAVLDQPDRLGDRLERVGAGLAEHDVVGVAVGHHVADVVHRRDQAALPHDVRRTAGALLVEEVGGGQGRGEDVVLRHVDAAAEQPGPQVAAGEDRVVGQQQVLQPAGLERVDELRRPRRSGPPRAPARRPCRSARCGSACVSVMPPSSPTGSGARRVGMRRLDRRSLQRLLSPGRRWRRPGRRRRGPGGRRRRRRRRRGRR